MGRFKEQASKKEDNRKEDRTRWSIQPSEFFFFFKKKEGKTGKRKEREVHSVVCH